MTDRDVMALGPIHAIEIFNASCADDNDSADSAYMLDMLLARGQRLAACATDDAHFVPNTHDRTAGWVMVRSETSDPDALLAALKAGDYYSSSGPEIHDLVVEPGRATTPPLLTRRPRLPHRRTREIQNHRRAGDDRGRIRSRSWTSPYARVLVRDDAGRKAWTNPDLVRGSALIAVRTTCHSEPRATRSPRCTGVRPSRVTRPRPRAAAGGIVHATLLTGNTLCESARQCPSPVTSIDSG